MSETSSAELQKMADEAAKKTVAELFTKLGLKIDDPIQVQLDFAHLRKQRLASEEISKLALRTVLAAIIVGCISALWIGLKAMAIKP